LPELPEVETTRIGITPYVLGETISNVIVREPRLRWLVPRSLAEILAGQTVRQLSRRAKYLLFYTEKGCLILHLGMSGSLRVITDNHPPDKYDHVDIGFTSGRCLRLRDPRRFGSIHWTMEDPLRHPLLCHLGPEPLSNRLTGNYFYDKSRNRTQSIKTFLMDSRVVAGVGNIYANEALYAAGIHPGRKAGKISKRRYEQLAVSVKDVLRRAIKKGGTTLRDFVDGEGNPGYFRNDLQIYQRGGETCRRCSTIIKTIRLGQRSTYYCPGCQR
jgi:formamidopyrimidine-DNA glycosylase